MRPKDGDWWHAKQKITLGEMRASGVRDLLVYCADYHCAHAVRISADQWPDNPAV
jgi:hypothetical protein